MLRSIFGRGKKRRRTSETARQDDSIRDARVGDVISIIGLNPEYDDVYFIIERVHRYSSHGETWHEMECVDGDNRVWIDWVDGYDLFITATDDPTPSGLSSTGITEDDLIELDEEHSIDNHIEIDGDVYYYKNSSEVSFFQDGRGPGQEYYFWEFTREQGDRVMSVHKWEGRPFEVVFSEVIPPELITLYKGEREDPGGQRNR